MRAIIFSTVAALAAAGCTMDTASNEVVVTEAGTPVAIVVPATEPMVVDPANAAPLPILGTWRCADSGFTITPGTYTTAGGNSMKIEAIERDSEGYRLVLQGNQKIRLTGIADGKLTWQNESTEGARQVSSCSMMM